MKRTPKPFLNVKKQKRKEKKPADGTDEVGELVQKNALYRYTLLQIVKIAHVTL